MVLIFIGKYKTRILDVERMHAMIVVIYPQGEAVAESIDERFGDLFKAYALRSSGKSNI